MSQISPRVGVGVQVFLALDSESRVWCPKLSNPEVGVPQEKQGLVQGQGKTQALYVKTFEFEKLKELLPRFALNGACDQKLT